MTHFNILLLQNAVEITSVGSEFYFRVFIKELPILFEKIPYMYYPVKTMNQVDTYFV